MADFPVLKDIDVISTDDPDACPPDHIQEARGLSANINEGFGGNFVWFRPIWTTKEDADSEGVTGIQALVGSDPQAVLFGEIRMLKDPDSCQRITDITLWRSTDPADNPRASGKYEFSTGNLNEGRGGDYLFLGWNANLMVYNMF